MSQKVWRNSEGREFPLWDGSQQYRDGANVQGKYVGPVDMRVLGYKLVDTDSESATQVGSPSGGTPLEEVIREAKREAWAEGFAAGFDSSDSETHSSQYPNPYDPKPPKGESEEFDVECTEKAREAFGVAGWRGVLRDTRLIPGKTYVVRLKESE